MLLMKCFVYLIGLHLTIEKPQLNLYHTDVISEMLQHDCLRIAVPFATYINDRQTVSYCMSELPSKFNIENDSSVTKFTFAELSKKNISSRHLYIWSAPIDIIERYQFYLDHLPKLKNSTVEKEIFYNCTWPRFGSYCQYELLYEYSNSTSLLKLIRHFPSLKIPMSSSHSCYIHLECDRGPHPACLDWTEICDGKLDCLNGQFDEEYCWQLEINECQDNEYRCMNGQCIPKSFYHDSHDLPDCIDHTDEVNFGNLPSCANTYYEVPSFGCSDQTCRRSHLTGSCTIDRSNLLIQAMYMSKNLSLSEECWSALKYLINSKSLSNEKEIMDKTCPDIFYFSAIPGLIDEIYFVYAKNDLLSSPIFSVKSFHICYNQSHYDIDFANMSKTFFNNMTCIPAKRFYPESIESWDILDFLNYFRVYNLLTNLKRYYIIPMTCNKSNLYQCINSSKCISIHRLLDTIYDCPLMDDEDINLLIDVNLMKKINKNRFYCALSNKYIHPILYENMRCDCLIKHTGRCEDEPELEYYDEQSINFQIICDGFPELSSIMLDGRRETDETECEQWVCNNIYTRCNDMWNCPNGADESGCDSLSTMNCSENHHLCVSNDTNQLRCLSINQVNDGHIDCLGATDEPTLCQSNTRSSTITGFYCSNESPKKCLSNRDLCNNANDCKYGDDERFCTTKHPPTSTYTTCWMVKSSQRTDVENFICHYTQPRAIPKKYFSMVGKRTLSNITKNLSPIIKLIDPRQPYCHRGLDLGVWLSNKKNLTRITCLCPPTFYGSHCQYQNQRISLGMKFRTSSDLWQTPFIIFVSLIDDSYERIIHSYEHFTYLSLRDCQMKFNTYLLYSTRPKDQTKIYSIHINIYEKLSLTYRTSLVIPIDFPFLPVYRHGIIIDIPRIGDQIKTCLNNPCIHGRCVHFSNRENLYFCQCEQGWSGRYCTIQHQCTCSSNSICIGISITNRSICLCPVQKFGPRCLVDSICRTNLCHNDGQCIPNDDHDFSEEEFVCICRKGFRGTRCEIIDNKLILSFANDLVLPQSIFIHFINIIGANKAPVRSTVLRTIQIQQDSVTIYWSQRFHVVFTELSNKTYYLTVVQNIYNSSTTIVKRIYPSDRCLHINELFNQTFVQWHLIRRIKYYHLPCQNLSLNLSCFYDDVQLCLCYDFKQQRLSNCLNFDHNMTFDCSGGSECQNGGQCFQDSPECSRKSICICPKCFYGIRCQFNTYGYGLSLDAILGYHIQPNVSFTDQSLIIKISLGLTIIIFLTGLINGIFCLITFKNRSVREVGCGLYLLGSSITTLLTMIMFGLKFLILILAQMSLITNRSILLSQCYSVDFILRICLTINQWSDACVAAERAWTTIKGARFDKKKSRRVAKIILIILVIIVPGTCVHDSIYRNLISEGNDDEDQTRIWCILTYNSYLQVYNYVIHCLHFFCPFLINLISIIILIKRKSERQLRIQPRRTFKEILFEQFREHKHLLTGPIVLIILALPRLIINFIGKCMTSTADSWLFLAGYFISFIPPIVTFLVFVLPSKFYREEFQKSVRQYRTTFIPTRH